MTSDREERESATHASVVLLVVTENVLPVEEDVAAVADELHLHVVLQHVSPLKSVPGVAVAPSPWASELRLLSFRLGEVAVDVLACRIDVGMGEINVAVRHPASFDDGLLRVGYVDRGLDLVRGGAGPLAIRGGVGCILALALVARGGGRRLRRDGVGGGELGLAGCRGPHFGGLLGRLFRCPCLRLRLVGEDEQQGCECLPDLHTISS